MHSTHTQTATDQEAGPDSPTSHLRLPRQSAPEAPGPHGAPAHGDPRVNWSTAELPPPPALRHRRDGILPGVAAALCAQGTTLTSTAARGDQPPTLHPLVQDFLDTLASDQRDRFTGRCAETLLISRHIGAADAARSKRAQRRPMTNGDARKALKNATLTARRIREDGDPLHGTYARPCRACTALAAHFGVRLTDPAPHSG